MYRPPYLKEGDQVALVSPAGAIAPEYIQEACRLLGSWSLRPVVFPHAYAVSGYFAGTDDERLDDMQRAMDDENIRAIFCTRGGYGSMRIVESLDYSCFQGSPKWLVGFSDITAFHSKLNTLGIESLHAPMPKSFSRTAPESMQRFKDFLFGDVSPYRLPPHPFNQEGMVKAELTGGNLTLLHCLRSTPLECRWQSPILFIEEVGEPLYAVDRMMQSLKLSEKFDRLQGIIMGEFSEMKGLDFGGSAAEILQESLSGYDFPVCFNFPAGHGYENFPLIMGATVEMEIGNEGSCITFLDD